MENEYLLPTNIKILDNITNGGIVKNGINTIAASCGNGKTILSSMIGVNLFNNGHKVLLLSIEDRESTTISLVYHILHNIELGANLNINFLPLLKKLIESNDNSGSFNVESMPCSNMDDVLKFIKIVHNELNIDILILDDIESIIGYDKTSLDRLREFINDKNITIILPLRTQRNLNNSSFIDSYSRLSKVDQYISIKQLSRKLNIFEFNVVKNRIGNSNSSKVKYVPRKFIVKDISIIDKIKLKCELSYNKFKIKIYQYFKIY